MEKDTKQVIRVGSRKSELALIQTNHVIDRLKVLNPDVEFKIESMSTLGDRILNVSLPKIGEKSLFTKDLEDALTSNAVDFVVHSLKDLPTSLPEGLAIGAVFEREDPRDALVLREDLKEHTLSTLPEGSVIGTSSLRRTAQIRGAYPQLVVKDVRGNLNTRLRKLDAGEEYAALMLAKSGLMRMGWEKRVSKVLPCAEMLYAIGQGALAVECRSDNGKILNMLSAFNHPETYCRILAERSFLKTLGGGCSAPVGVATTLKPFESQYKLTISGAVWSIDGKTKIYHKIEHVFNQIRLTKHKLSPVDIVERKKAKVGNEPLDYNERITDDPSSCVDLRSEEEIAALREIHCGLTVNFNVPNEVIVTCKNIGKELADVLVEKGALEVMKVTQDMIAASIKKS